LLIAFSLSWIYKRSRKRACYADILAIHAEI
jgi:hypothetical protein